MENETPKAPGLIWKPRKGGRAPVWRAARAAVAAGYPVKSVPLSAFAGDPLALVARCHRLQAEMNEWMAGQRGNAVAFDGTFGTLIKKYLTDPDSPYRDLKPASRHPYDIYAGKLIGMIGTRRIDACDGRDVKRWFATWSAPDQKDGRPKIAAARAALTVIKASVSFGITCRLPGCLAFKGILSEMEFPMPRPRQQAPSAADVIAARKSAHAIGHPSAALAYALQYEGPLRQWDVTGQWIPIGEQQPSSIFDGKTKWIGPTWAQVSDTLIFTVTPGKTDETTGARVVIDLKLCPMVMEELALIPLDRRTGPIVKHPTSGLPYTQWVFRDLWRRVADHAGLPKTLWNRDLRAGGNTEAQNAGTRREDRSAILGHGGERMVAQVYDRGKLEAHRRVMAARKAHREGKNEG